MYVIYVRTYNTSRVGRKPTNEGTRYAMLIKVMQMLERIHWQPAFQVVLREVSWGMGAVNHALHNCPFLCSFPIFAHFLFNCQRLLGDLLGSWAIRVPMTLSALLSYQRSPRAFQSRKDHLMDPAVDQPLGSESKELQQLAQIINLRYVFFKKFHNYS